MASAESNEIKEFLLEQKNVDFYAFLPVGFDETVTLQVMNAVQNYKLKLHNIKKHLKDEDAVATLELLLANYFESSLSEKIGIAEARLIMKKKETPVFDFFMVVGKYHFLLRLPDKAPTLEHIKLLSEAVALLSAKNVVKIEVVLEELIKLDSNCFVCCRIEGKNTIYNRRGPSYLHERDAEKNIKALFGSKLHGAHFQPSLHSLRHRAIRKFFMSEGGEKKKVDSRPKEDIQDGDDIDVLTNGSFSLKGKYVQLQVTLQQGADEDTAADIFKFTALFWTRIRPLRKQILNTDCIAALEHCVIDSCRKKFAQLVGYVTIRITAQKAKKSVKDFPLVVQDYYCLVRLGSDNLTMVHVDMLHRAQELLLGQGRTMQSVQTEIVSMEANSVVFCRKAEGEVIEVLVGKGYTVEIGEESTVFQHLGQGAHKAKILPPLHHQHQRRTFHVFRKPPSDPRQASAVPVPHPDDDDDVVTDDEEEITLL